MGTDNKKLTKERLLSLLKEAAAAHHKYEQQLGREHKEWAEWYADYIIEKLEKDG